MKKLLILMMCMFLLVAPLISSAGLTSIDDFKTYDKDISVYSLKNFFGLGKTISTLELITPQNYQVGLGYQKVAEIDIINGEYDYEEIIKGIELYNIRDGMKDIVRDVDYKYKVITQVPNYVQDCKEVLSVNGTLESVCVSIENGTKDKITWEDFTKNSLKIGEKITLGLFTTTKQGDHIEWILNVYGNERLTAWASWTAGLNTGLVAYFKLSDLGEEIEQGNLTNYNSAGFSVGKIGNAIDFGSANTNKYLQVENDFGVDGGTASLSLWFESAVQPGTSQILVNQVGTTTHAGYSIWYTSTGVFYNRGKANVADQGVTYTTTLTNGTWYNIVLTYDSAGELRGYLNGALVTAPTAVSGNGTTATQNFTIGSYYAGSDLFAQGKVDEVAFWNRNITQTEITQLYNEGAGIQYTTVFSPSVNLNFPANTTNTTNPTVNFNGTISAQTPVNVSLIIDGTYNETNTSGILGDYLFTKTLSESSHTWNYESCNAEGCNNGTERSLTIDYTNPTITVESPTETLNYLYQNYNITLNTTITDTNLNICWHDYNNTNTTFSCSTGVKTNTGFNYQPNFNNITIWANDSVGNQHSNLTSWNVKVLENNRTVNTTSYETKSETFSINLTANSSLTAVTLDYNGTEYATTKSGTVYSKTFDIPTGIQNRSVRWKFTYGTNFYSTYSYQNILTTVFTLCNATYADDFLNISFKDEGNNAVINASIPTSNFIYYLGSGSVTKTYTYVNSSDNYYYSFCATPNLNLNVDSYIQYKQGSAYPQRVYDPDVISYTSTVTDKILYLLGVSDGIYVTFQVVNSATQPISNVEIIATREIGGTDTIVGQGTTGDDGGVTLWLNPDFIHDFSFAKTGFTTYETSFAPTQTAYTITLSGGTTITSSYFKGIDYSILPTNTSLTNDTIYTFGFSLTSSFWDLDEYGFDLRLTNGTIITGSSTTTSGTPLTLNYNTTNQTKIYLDYYWIINSTTTSGIREWVIYSTEYTQWSIATFFTDLTLYLDSGFFGIDNFGRSLIMFIVIFFTAGIVSYKFGFTSPVAVSTTIFLTVFFLETIIGIIPPFVLPSGHELPSVLSFITGLILIMVIFHEVRNR